MRRMKWIRTICACSKTLFRLVRSKLITSMLNDCIPWYTTLTVLHLIYNLLSSAFVQNQESQKREETYLRRCAPIEDSNQPAHPRSLIKVFVVRMKKFCVLCYPKCAQLRFLLGCANAQADLNLYWAHISRRAYSDVAAQIDVFSCFILCFCVQIVHVGLNQRNAAMTNADNEDSEHTMGCGGLFESPLGSHVRSYVFLSNGSVLLDISRTQEVTRCFSE